MALRHESICAQPTDTSIARGADAFSERAAHELIAVGDRARRRPHVGRSDLTPQEAQIARLAAERRTNAEIGAQLFISPRTVEYHLAKVFSKLGIQSRRDLPDANSDLRRVVPDRCHRAGPASSPTTSCHPCWRLGRTVRFRQRRGASRTEGGRGHPGTARDHGSRRRAFGAARPRRRCRDGRSGAAVVHGQAGIGKTTLLEDAARAAEGFLVLRVQGAESEAGLGFAALHRLLSPVVASMAELPTPQRRALEVTFGVGEGPAPDRFLVGLAALTLLDDLALQQPVLCLIDDGQWLDKESLSVLAFVARRLDAESVAMLFTFRDSEDGASELPEGLPLVSLGPLASDDAQQLLRSVVSGPIDDAVSSRIVDECGGSPLAIVELAAGLSPEQLLSSDLLPLALPVGERLDRHFLGQVDALGPDARALLLIAAVDTTGDVSVVLDAAGSMGLGADVLESIEASGLVRFAPTVAFRHPLVRSAIISSADFATLRRVHRAIAGALDEDRDGATRMWHLAAATLGTDPAVADALDQLSDQARLRGSPAAEAALRTRAAELTSDHGVRIRRQIEAGHAHLLAGSPRKVTELVDSISLAAQTDRERAEAARLRALLVSFNTPGPAPRMLLEAADLARAEDPNLAFTIDTEAIQAALVSCQLTEGVAPREIAEQVLAASPEAERSEDVGELLRAGYAALLTGDHVRGTALLQRALDRAVAFGDDRPRRAGALDRVRQQPSSCALGDRAHGSPHRSHGAT